MQTVLVHYASEVSLKGKNRSDFENQLVRNIKKSLGDNLKSIKQPYSRILLEVSDAKKAEVNLGKIFGISWFAFVDTCDSDIESIKKLALKSNIKGKTFKVQSKRSDKKFPIKSTEVNQIVGEALFNKYKSEVSMKNPAVIVHVNISEKETYVFSNKISGAGGLPVGTSGKVLVLMSGGIDSPVAAHLIMKRGCTVDYLHFHALRSDKEVKDTKIPKIIKKLQEYDPDSKLYLQSHHDFDIASQAAPSEFHLILFRRYMFKVAEKLAEKIGAKAIVSGDNLAQVASQTLDNIANVDRGLNIPIFRPVLTYDKQEIINLAEKIDTYKITIQPYKDCCAIISKKPKTKPKLEKVERFEKQINSDSLILETMKKF